MRIAYLLEDWADSHKWLDAIFADCFSRDGGRQSLVVPVAASTISKRYEDWLQLLDPDVVVLLTFDNAALLPRLSELLGGTAIVERKRIQGQLEEHPRVSIESSGLTALSWLPFLKARASALQVAPEFILDRYPAWGDDGFVGDNFGTLYGSGNGFQVYEQIAMRGLMLTPEDAPENPWHIKCVNAEEIPDGDALLVKLTERGKIATVAQLSNMNCQSYDVPHPWKSGFCLVIGDTFTDRICCWNAGLVLNDAHVQPYSTLRVPSVVRSNAARTTRIGEFLKRWNWIGQHNGPAHIVIRSYSLSQTDLEEFVTGIQNSSTSIVSFSPILSLDDCCPADISQIPPHRSFGGVGPGISEAAVNGPVTVLDVPKPIQLNYSAGMHPIFSRGSWYVDMAIDRLNDQGQFGNVRHTWKLPIANQVVPLFHNSKVTRLTRSRELTVKADIRESEIEVKQPEDDQLFLSIICERPHYPYGDLRSAAATSAGYKFASISDKGRYLQGVLGMLGGLSAVEYVLGSHFWRTQLMSMASPALDQGAEVIKQLQRRLKAKDGKLTIDDESGWRNLSDRVIQIVKGLKTPREKTRYEKLLKSWAVELEAAIAADIQLQPRRDEILAEAPAELKRSLSGLVASHVFYRGHEWSCRHCSHRNWMDVEALSDVLSCDVCQSDHQLPVDVALDFRLNEFLSACLREHDTLTVAWALCHLRSEARHCFIFSPQIALYRDYPENQGYKADRELDILCIVDGRLVVGEAKQSVIAITRAHIQDLAEAATELRADIAFIAAFTGDDGLMKHKVAQLRTLLPPSVEVRGLISQWDEQPSAYL